MAPAQASDAYTCLVSCSKTISLTGDNPLARPLTTDDDNDKNDNDNNNDNNYNSNDNNDKDK